MRNSYLFLLLAAAAGLSCAPGDAVALTVADLAPGDLVITEYLANPVGVADSAGEYFEVFNRREAAVDLAGLLVRDDGSNQFVISALSVAAGGFAVLGNGDGSELGIAVDYSYGGAMSLTNTADQVVLVSDTQLELFRLEYSDGDAFGAGIAHELAAVAPGMTSATGPAAGSDFRAATAALLLDNYGSPGAAGNTALAPVPLPGACWLLGSGLAWLGTWRCRRPRAPGG